MASDDKLCPELYDYIIDFLHDDEPALRASALVCHSWLPASRFHLFCDLKLTGSGPSPTNSWAQDTSCRRIFGTVLSSPHIASYIKTLSVVESNVVRPSTYRWVSGEITFPALLKKLASVRALEFNFPPPCPADTKTSWSTMVFRDISDAMSAMILDSLTLRHFLFTSLADFVKILDSSRHLKTLQLDHVDIATANHLTPSALDHFLGLQPFGSLTRNFTKKACIETLLLRSNSSYLIIPVLLHTFSSLDFSNLRSLIMNVTPDSYNNVLELLKCVPSLESLELEIDHDFDYDAHLDHKDVIDMSFLRYLKSLSLQSSVLLGRTEPLRWLLATLSTSAHANTLQDLSLTCIVDKPPPTVTIQAFDNILIGWRNLDDLLTQPTFASMRRFRLDFALDDPIGDESAELISQEFVKQLQGLRGKGILEVDVCEVR
ncbi:hypothetical protein GALMADRAFT_135836 [Galerina marginata CBS 339.88]|uniref:F-box domain-containing protein n=1 Tax=Galerina marginata (strain CBS 339.88) TaxID=685588 RepID=A0A067TBW2_GALM3|nr:hypothetical protein GALMADRAFT_135836 [Galerina marginata CBS 339.88]